MLKMASSFVSSLLCGVVLGIGMIAYLSLSAEQPLLAALVLAGLLFAIENLGLKFYVTKTPESFMYKKKEEKKFLRVLLVWIGNFLGLLLVVLLLNGRLQETANAYYNAKCSLFLKLGNDLFSGFFGGILIYMIHRIYTRSESAVTGGLAAVLLAPVLTIPGVDFGALITFVLMAAKRLKPVSIRHCAFVLLGNLLGAVFVAALAYLIKQLNILAERNDDGRLYKHHHHHHHRRRSEDKEESAESENA